MVSTLITVDVPTFYFMLSVSKQLSGKWEGKNLRQVLSAISCSLGIFMDDETSREILRSFLESEERV